MNKYLVVATAAVCLLVTGCVKPDSLYVNGVSKHMTQKGKDSSNIGIGVKKGAVEVGVTDNSRIKPSLSVYATRDLYRYRNCLASGGAAIYDGQSGYDISLKPIAKVGCRFGNIETGFIAPDIAYGRFAMDIGKR